MREMILQRWNALSSRERLLVMGGGVVTAASLYFVLGIDPLLSRLEMLDQQQLRKQRAIRELAELGAEHASLQARLNQMEARFAGGKANFSLLSFLEEAAAQSKIRDRIAAMQPQVVAPALGYKEAQVEVRLDGVPMPSLLGFLNSLESSPRLLYIKRVQMKARYDAPEYLDATIRVSTFEKEK